MKTKKFNKRLALNKRTIANLEKNAMGNIHGGGETDACTDECTLPQSCIIPCLPNTGPVQCPETAWRCTYDPELCGALP